MSNKVPLLRFNGYSDAWVQRKLSELMSFSNGINAAKEQYGTGRKMISVMDILTPGRMKFENILNSVSVSHDIEEKNLVNSGDLVFVRSSEVTSEVGWAKAYTDSNPALFSGFSIRGKKATSFDSVFVELALNSRGRRQIERQAGGSTRFNASQGLLSNIAINMPSEEEQSKISSMMLQLDNLIAANQRKLDLLKEQKKGYLQKMFPKNGEKVPELRFAGFVDDWEERKLRDLLNKNSEKNKNLSVINVESVSNKTGFTKQTDQFEDYSVASADLSNYYVIREKQFAYNPSRINVGSIAYKDLGDEISVVSPLYVSFSTKKVLNDGFLWNWFKTASFDAQRQRLSEGGVRDTLSFNQLSEMNTMFPTYPEQEKIGSFFKLLDDTIALHQRKLDLLKEQKKGFLQKMFV